ncbi:hypothetical protein [Candidatus Accumulibacter sp. ACC007]|uniref:hypothetical protein n=1 Tax=Candidatus Accumulibacter sp. ACC007 TaxID=2823333 RepID=UPI0025C6840D|nr:hypothetical protein [Candidatus Accumulibacter sp. ACC007]
MKRLATAIAITAALAAAATQQYLHASTDPQHSALHSRLHAVERTLSATQQDILGYTTFTQYLEVTKKAISGRTKFLAARIDRNYVHVEHINRSALGIKSDAVGAGVKPASTSRHKSGASKAGAVVWNVG